MEEVETDAVKHAKKLEMQGVEQAESGNTARALELFNQAILSAPAHASSFNNRAQALRLQGDVQGLSDFFMPKTLIRIGTEEQKKFACKIVNFSFLSVLTFVLGAQKNCLIEMFLLSTILC